MRLSRAVTAPTPMLTLWYSRDLMISSLELQGLTDSASLRSATQGGLDMHVQLPPCRRLVASRSSLVRINACRQLLVPFLHRGKAKQSKDIQSLSQLLLAVVPIPRGQRRWPPRETMRDQDPRRFLALCFLYSTVAHRAVHTHLSRVAALNSQSVGVRYGQMQLDNMEILCKR